MEKAPEAPSVAQPGAAGAPAPTVGEPATPPAPGNTPSGPPDQAMGSAPAPGGRDRIRTNLKIAGFTLMLVGALFTLQYGQYAVMGPQVETWSSIEGGNLTVQAPPESQVTLQFKGAAQPVMATVGESGKYESKLPEAYVTVESRSGNDTVVRKAIVPAGMSYLMNVSQPPADASTVEGLDIARFQAFWIPAAIAFCMVLGGLFTFLLRAPKLALAGAAIGIVGSLLSLLMGAVSMQSLVALAASGFAAWGIRKHKARFLPLPVGRLSL